MTYLLTDGPPHYKVSTHAWTPSGDVSAAVTFNDPDATYPAAAVLPWIHVLNVTNWRHGVESEDNRQARTISDGEITYPSKKLGVTKVCEYEIRADSVRSLDQTLTAVVAAFDNMSDEGTMAFTPYEGGPVWAFDARVLSLEPDPDWDYNDEGRGWAVQQGFQLSLRLSDPYFYAVSDPTTRSL